MAYVLNRTNGNILVSLGDGTVDTSTTDITLIGRNYPVYGESQNENFIKILENFSNTVAPASPLSGQLWYDSGNIQLQYRNNASGWNGVATLTKKSTEPSGMTTGDLWYDSTNSQLFIKTSDGTRLVGPMMPTGFGNTLIKAETLTDTLAGTHEVLSFYTGNTRIAVLNGDSAFSTVTSGFANVVAGFTLNTNTATVLGTATNSLALNNLASTSFVRSDANSTMSGTLAINNNSGLSVGSAQQTSIAVSSNIGVITNNTGLIFRSTYSATDYDYIKIDGSANTVTILNLTAPGLVSSSANALSTARKIELTGAVTGNVLFDGTGNVSIATTANVTPVAKSGDTMSGALNLPGNGLTVGTNQLAVVSSKVCVNTISPVSALTVDGAIFSSLNNSYAGNGAIAIDAAASNSHHIVLTGSATLTINNFTTNGQFIRVILSNTTNSVTWPGTIYWPNGVTPNLALGPNKIAVVTLFKITGATLASYVTY